MGTDLGLEVQYKIYKLLTRSRMQVQGFLWISSWALSDLARTAVSWVKPMND